MGRKNKNNINNNLPLHLHSYFHFPTPKYEEVEYSSKEEVDEDWLVLHTTLKVKFIIDLRLELFLQFRKILTGRLRSRGGPQGCLLLLFPWQHGARLSADSLAQDHRLGKLPELLQVGGKSGKEELLHVLMLKPKWGKYN